MTKAIRVLIADDEVEYAESLARALRRRGMAVSVVHDGAEVLEALRRDEFDVIVMDVRMPGMDGLVALAEVRRADPYTAVILLSGHADLQSATDAIRRGATDFLFKPCTVENLISAIEDAAERKAVARELGEAAPPSPGGSSR